MILKKVFAWTAHFYTALGLVLAAFIAVLIVRGGDGAFRLAFMLMLAATLIDATDGWLARRVHVHEETPNFDGRRLDDLIDFHTYTTLPLLLVWRAGTLPPAWQWVLLIPLLASAYGFSQVHAKTGDNYFLGFPSYWNIIAFYLYVLKFPAWASIAILAGFGLLTFVPLRYLYPTQKHAYSLVTNLLGALWTLELLFVLILWQRAPRFLILSSVAYPAYYLAASWTVSIRHWRATRHRP